MLQAVRRGGVYVCVADPHATKGASKFRVRMATDCKSCRANRQVIHAILFRQDVTNYRVSFVPYTSNTLGAEGAKKFGHPKY